jgi:intracellular septation protein A
MIFFSGLKGKTANTKFSISFGSLVVFFCVYKSMCVDLFYITALQILPTAVSCIQISISLWINETKFPQNLFGLIGDVSFLNI